MDLHLAEASRHVSPGARCHDPRWCWLACKAGALVIPENITLLQLPRYSPEFNPDENVWEFLKQNFVSSQAFANYEASSMSAATPETC
jgi:hypothetical protein